MADVHIPILRRRIRPAVQSAMEQLEGTCRTYDANIMRCIWILLALVIWMVAADAMLPPAATFEYQDEVAEGKAVDVTDDVPKRTFGRVMRTMREHCQSGIVLGPRCSLAGSLSCTGSCAYARAARTLSTRT